MSLIARDTDYGVRALSYIAVNGDSIVTVKELVEELDMPYAFTRKILQKLTRARILVSYKGKGGGFELKKNPARIRLVDIIKIFQGKIDLTQCMFRKKICPNLGECKLRKKIKKIEKYIVNEFSTVTLDFLISK